MKGILSIILVLAVSNTARAEDSTKRATIEIAVYQSSKAGIASNPDVKQWMRQKLVVSQTFTFTVPNSIRIKTVAGGKVYEFQFEMEEAVRQVATLKHVKISVPGVNSPITSDQATVVLNEWMSVASEAKVSKYSYLGTMVVAKYTEALPNN